MAKKEAKLSAEEDRAERRKGKSSKPRDKTFGCPDWVEDNVIPMGNRAAKCWRGLVATHKIGTPFENPNNLRKDWEKVSPHIKNWK